MPSLGSFLKLFIASTVLTLFLAPTSLAGGAETTTTTTSDQWYITKWSHAHGEHAAHSAGGPRLWEPYRQIDPRTVSGYQEMYEVTQFPREEPATDAQRRQAEEFVRRCREAAARH